MEKKFFQVSIAIIFLIAACSQVPERVAPPATGTSIPSQKRVSSSTPISILSKTSSEPRNAPTGTPLQPTSLPTIPTFTPTFDASTIVTVTPAMRAECPKENPSLKLSFHFDDPNIKPEEEILNFLNNGGSPKTILSALPSDNYPNRVRVEDLTGDKTPEFSYIYYDGNAVFYIFTCFQGKYTLYRSGWSGWMVHFYGVLDMNLNGLPELIVVSRSCTGGGCYRYYILEWNGATYVDLISEADMWIDGAIGEQVIDTNNDGTLELVIKNVPPTWSAPWRVQIKTLAWDGKLFSAQPEKFEQPLYRFQAIQDGDIETTLGNYNTALNLYRQAIFHEELEWWSVERKEYEQPVIDAPWHGAPTPSVERIEDLTEYPRLAAYAYYRIMLLHLAQGEETEAETAYQTLQRKFGDDPYGRSYVEMATAFRETYQSTHKMYDGCAAAIQYAAEHREVLRPLGSDYHGSQSHTYLPSDVCPFR